VGSLGDPRNIVFYVYGLEIILMVKVFAHELAAFECIFTVYLCIISCCVIMYAHLLVYDGRCAEITFRF